MKTLLKKLIPSREFRLWFIAMLGGIIMANTTDRLEWYTASGIMFFIVSAVAHKHYLKKWFIERGVEEYPVRTVHYQDIGDQIRNSYHVMYPYLTKAEVDQLVEGAMAIIRREL